MRGTVQTILLVKDDNRTRKFVHLAPQEAGYEVREATYGKEALRRVQFFPTNLVITDIGMPGMR